MNIIWLTDLHFDFLNHAGKTKFIDKIKAQEPDIILISGDIAHADSLTQCLDYFQSLTYFVLGNHDYYMSSISKVTSKMVLHTNLNKRLNWLTILDVVELDKKNALIGHDGWADGRFGDYIHSDVFLNDYMHIEDLNAVVFSKEERLTTMQKLAQQGADYIDRIMPEALEYENIWMITHPPPFEEASWHLGKPSDTNWLPHFASKVMGQVLIKHMKDKPNKMTVLCGHTHSPGECDPLPNIHVYTGEAKYHRPQIQKVFKI